MATKVTSTVSVVITCYNQARFIGETIEAALAQTVQPLEIVVVDDGSKDNTPEVISKYPQARYIRQSNQGVSVARNVGLYQAKGRYLVFVDGDDRLLPEALKIGADSLDAHPECAFVSGYCQFIAPDGSPLPTLHQQYVEEPDYSTLLRDNHIWMPAMVMHRRENLASLGGFDIKADHSGDYELYLRIARSFPIYCHRQTIAEWRLHSANTSHNTALMLKATLGVFRSQWDYVKNNKQYMEAYKNGLDYWKTLYGSQLIIVATSVDGVPEVVLDGKNGLLYPHQDDEKLATQLLTLLKDKAYAVSLGEAGRQFVKTNFSRDQFATNIINLYREMLHIAEARSASA